MRGGKRVGAGRKPGSRLVKTAQVALELAEQGATPLEVLLSVMRDESQPLSIRLSCAQVAAPYIHPRLANVNQDIIQKEKNREEKLKVILQEWRGLREKTYGKEGQIVEHKSKIC